MTTPIEHNQCKATERVVVDVPYLILEGQAGADFETSRGVRPMVQVGASVGIVPYMDIGAFVRSGYCVDGRCDAVLPGGKVNVHNPSRTYQAELFITDLPGSFWAGGYNAFYALPVNDTMDFKLGASIALSTDAKSPETNWLFQGLLAFDVRLFPRAQKYSREILKSPPSPYQERLDELYSSLLPVDHYSGKDSPEVKTALKSMDGLIADLGECHSTEKGCFSRILAKENLENMKKEILSRNHGENLRKLLFRIYDRIHGCVCGLSR